MELERLLRRLVRNVVMGLWVMALLISSSIICTTNMKPKIWGIPALGAFGYLIAFAIVMYVFLKSYFFEKIGKDLHRIDKNFMCKSFFFVKACVLSPVKYSAIIMEVYIRRRKAWI